jgi:hypothetical protein
MPRMSIRSNKTANGIRQICGDNGGWTICLGSISHVHGPMGDQKTASYSGHPEFDSRSEEYPKMGLETFVSVFIYLKQ